MKKKDKIIAFAVSIFALLNSYKLLKKINDDINNTLITSDKSIEEVIVKEKEKIEEKTEEKTEKKIVKNIEVQLVTKKEIEDDIGIKIDNSNENGEKVKENKSYIRNITFDTNKYGYIKNDTSINSISHEEIGDISKYQLVNIDWETNEFYHGKMDDNSYGFFNKDDIEILPSKFIEVDIDSQTLNLYSDENIILTTDVTTGRENKYDTRLGYFYVYYKQYDTFLVGPGYKLHVDYWIPFDGGIGFHDAFWRSEFGGDIYKTNGSHGCVNMPHEAAQTLYNNIDANTRVLVHK